MLILKMLKSLSHNSNFRYFITFFIKPIRSNQLSIDKIDKIWYS